MFTLTLLLSVTLLSLVIEINLENENQKYKDWKFLCWYVAWIYMQKILQIILQISIRPNSELSKFSENSSFFKNQFLYTMTNNCKWNFARILIIEEGINIKISRNKFDRSHISPQHWNHCSEKLAPKKWKLNNTKQIYVLEGTCFKDVIYHLIDS